MKTEKMINALFAMYDARESLRMIKPLCASSTHPSVQICEHELETAKQEFDTAFMEAVDSHIKETSKQ